MSNPNSQIVDIINNFLKDNKLVDARTCEGEFLGMHSSLTVGGAHEVVEELEKLISDQVAKAKIEEIDAIPDYGLEEPTDYACYDLNHQFNRCVSCYKKMRLATLNGVNNNE